MVASFRFSSLRRPATACLVASLGGASLAHAQGASAAPSGASVYSTTCAACHQPTGAGLPEKYPPLAGSEILTGDVEKVVRIVLQGLTGPVEVQGETFNAAMPGWGPTLSDAQIAAVLTYARASWGNGAAPITAQRVAQVRSASAARTTPWTIAELQKLAVPVAK